MVWYYEPGKKLGFKKIATMAKVIGTTRNKQYTIKLVGDSKVRVAHADSLVKLEKNDVIPITGECVELGDTDEIIGNKSSFLGNLDSNDGILKDLSPPDQRRDQLGEI